MAKKNRAIVQMHYSVTRTKTGLDIKPFESNNKNYTVPKDMFEYYLNLDIGKSSVATIIIHPDEYPGTFYAVR